MKKTLLISLFFILANLLGYCQKFNYNIKLSYNLPYIAEIKETPNKSYFTNNVLRVRIGGDFALFHYPPLNNFTKIIFCQRTTKTPLIFDPLL